VFSINLLYSQNRALELTILINKLSNDTEDSEGIQRRLEVERNMDLWLCVVEAIPNHAFYSIILTNHPFPYIYVAFDKGIANVFVEVYKEGAELRAFD